MSSPLFRADLASGCPVVFSRREKPALVFERLSTLPKLAGITRASRLEARPTLEMVSSGIREIDALTGGLPRGCLTEICGPASSGRTSVLLAALAAATRRQEICALVDASDAFDPLSGAAAGVDFEKMLWVRCGEKNPPQRHNDTEKENGGKTQRRMSDAAAERRKNAAHGASRGNQTETTRDLKGRQKRYSTPSEGPLENALRATDLLLQSSGFGMIIMDLGDIPFQSARRIPLTTWFRFQRAVETTPTILFVIAENPLAPACASLLVKVQSSAVGRQSSGKISVINSTGRKGHCLNHDGTPAHAQLLDGLSIEGELLRSRLERKPAQSVTTAFTTSSERIA
jgi:recA bacterial DNA recombination protein